MYKHKFKNKFIFINNTNNYIEVLDIEKFNPKINTYFFNLNEQKEKLKYEKLIEKSIKRGFEPYYIPTDIQDKTNTLIDNIEIDKVYYFVQKNNQNILDSNIITLKLMEFDDKFFLQSISLNYLDNKGNTILPTLRNFIANNIPCESNSLSKKDVFNLLSYHINMLFILEFEQLDVLEVVSLCTGKLIPQDITFDEKFYKHKKSSKFYCVSPKPDFGFMRLIKYTIDNNEIKDSDTIYQVEQNPQAIKDNVRNFENHNAFDKPISKEEFFKQYKDKTKSPRYFKKPVEKEFSLPRFPIEAPSNQLDIAKLKDTILEENKYYFFANTTEINPLDWQVSFIVLADAKEDWYCYSEPFRLKDFNKASLQPKGIELKYSDDRKSFANKIKKRFKPLEIDSKSISTDTIFEILSGKKLEMLNKQEKIDTFVMKNESWYLVVEVFNNYACLRDDSINHLYWQFFKDVDEREAWLKTYQTTKTKLYNDTSEYILKHTNEYLNKNKMFKKILIDNPLFKNIFTSIEDKNRFYKSSIVTKEAMHIKGDYTCSFKNTFSIDKKLIIIEGDMIVEGTLYFKENNNYIIIKGNLKAENLILKNYDCELIYVEGNVDIKEITKTSYRLICENAKTKILLHTHREALDIITNFNYDYEVSIYSKAITNKNVITKDILGFLCWNEEEIVHLLANNQSFLTDKIENTKTDLDEYYKNKFENRMLDWGYFYPEYVGCEILSISEDNEIKGNCIYPGSGDWVINDIRGKSGTYGVSHEDYSICKLKVNNPEDYNIDYTQKPLNLMVNVKELMSRYVDISMLYMNWAHRKTVSFSTEAELKSKYKKYESEKVAFKDDPYLALYWLNHFGVTLDKKYDEVVAIINKYNLTEKLPILKEPLAFFKKTDAFYNLVINGSDKEELKELFLMRRAYLVYRENVYKNYDINNLDLWWKSITIYPKVDEQLIIRMRWLKNNLTKCNAWKAFDELIKTESKNIPLLSYVFACNPNSTKKKKTKYADILIDELFEHRDKWKGLKKVKFAEIMLWDVRECVSDKTTLEKVAKFYFRGHKTSKEYQDIQSVLERKRDTR